jgi:hypothetical protein
MAPAHQHHFVEITCPDTGHPIMVARRVDPITRLFTTNQITRHQRDAAQAYQEDVEAMAGSHRASSLGPERDTAGWRASRPGSNSKTHDRLTRAHAALGPDLSRLINAVLIDGQPVLRSTGRALHQALDRLAVVYGMATATKH